MLNVAWLFMPGLVIALDYKVGDSDRFTTCTGNKEGKVYRHLLDSISFDTLVKHIPATSNLVQLETSVSYGGFVIVIKSS